MDTNTGDESREAADFAWGMAKIGHSAIAVAMLTMPDEKQKLWPDTLAAVVFMEAANLCEMGMSEEVVLDAVRAGFKSARACQAGYAGGLQ